MGDGLVSEDEVLARAVKLVLSGDTDEVLALLARFYRVSKPGVKVGLPKGRKAGVLGCYDPRRQIYVRSSAEFRNPFVIMHEFYHHLRMFGGRHRGCERGANEYALRALAAFSRVLREEGSGGSG